MTEATLTLSKDQVKAARTADHVCFNHRENKEGVIRFVKRIKESPWNEEREVSCPVQSRVHCYGDQDVSRATCFQMIHCASFCEEWQTIAGLLKEGDEVSLLWEASEGNGYVGRATVTEEDAKSGNAGLGQKLCHDRLYLKIRRGGKSKYSFYLSDSVCPNNTARMIRP